MFPGRAAQNQAVTGPCRPQLYAVLGSLLSIKLPDPLRTATASPFDFASSVTSFHFSHFFCFVIPFEFGPKRTPFCCFIFCKTASLMDSSVYLSLSSTTRLVTLVVQTVTGDRSSKRIRETPCSASCHLSLRHQSPRHLSHQSFR